ncbi:5-demethoxyubiquinone hydroxylase, mitochondrial-like [Acanthaster planci]|uniref:5-demethoxyubiquinone hydroxylase, mitochondrial n=1 Tax=Acanthaster planci TaxID=133434 RepID=A0A8B7YG62_ACAPL|nr:5-demethoxyubiquinone hydroxylase, mitochondrial-like [Acanthaster planci]XP_022091385.1 5-demethoxyubiquinone hydroxylase, mitochondrial-like [Acanthaster planci]
MQASQARSLTCLVCRTHRYAAQAIRRSPLLARHASSEARRQAMIDRIIRVDHAGEVGADRIYAGQMAILGKTSVGSVIQEMWDQEKHHRETFERLVPERRVRPTVLLPVWNIAGFVLGASTALLGKEGAMACTVAVEESIGEHYNSQIRELLEDDPEEHAELLKIIKEFRDEELEHLDKGLEHDAEQAPMYSALSNVIKAGCSAAIWLSERI